MDRIGLARMMIGRKWWSVGRGESDRRWVRAWTGRLIEVISERVKRDLATAAELGLSQTAPAEIVESRVPA